ncbi:tripartite tricarboxylate transporter substrate binding protein [Roseomonas sp. HJA6]|uniref:Tripartite tricarboxylate transporter substrate binding protein n=1 Tax=Roseomonas alba TaxID=2846776 RepID=A0ABS7A1U1_9PROT|nr:tripartite tricarboxylate transporter substrate binding protein [Neoroseomonas alba]MBW6396292.1 tripartite tricarboxylate transporter substrate binding protein [Neoroseomonas alba]
MLHSPSRRALLMAATLTVPAVARAQSGSYPNRPLRVVVPFAPGGITDILARAAAEGLSREIGQLVVVDNRAGAGGNVGSEAVAKSAPDGYTILAVGPAVMGIAKPLYARLNYDPDTDFAALGVLGAQPNVMLVSPRALPEPTLDALVAKARAKPGEVAFASSGSGSLTHLTAELFAKDAGLQMVHVPYRGSPPALADLVSGQVAMMCDALTTALPLHQSGQARIVGIATRERAAELPEVPSLVEAGYPSLDVPNWFGMFVPAATPAPVVDQLRMAVAAVTASDNYRALMRARSATLVTLGEGGLDGFLARERTRWAVAVQASGARVD